MSPFIDILQFILALTGAVLVFVAWLKMDVSPKATGYRFPLPPLFFYGQASILGCLACGSIRAATENRPVLSGFMVGVVIFGVFSFAFSYARLYRSKKD
jgi:hypothetical protein